MGTQAIIDPSERGHLIGDVAALFVAVVLLGWLTPRGKRKGAVDDSTAWKDHCPKKEEKTWKHRHTT